MTPLSLAASHTAELPRLAPGHLPRPRLRDALLQADCRLRLLCAPAGSGKSVLLSECAQQCPADTTLFYLDLRGKALSVGALFYRLANVLGALRADLDGLTQQLVHCQGPVWLILDDYPRLDRKSVV